MDTEAARDRLQQLERELLARIEEITGNLEAGSTPDSAEGGGDVGDEGAHEQQAAENEGLLDGAHRRLGTVQDALARIDAGTYGISVVSGKPIPAERLEARPDAATLADEQL